MKLDKFERMIAKGKLEDALSYLFARSLTEGQQDKLLLIQMKLSMIQHGIMQGKVLDIEQELKLKEQVGYALLQAYDDIEAEA